MKLGIGSYTYMWSIGEGRTQHALAKDEIKRAAPGLSVANAAQLGGSPAANFQQRVTGSCAAATGLPSHR